ncbi:PREDICTED: cytokinin hydroxylase-like [Nelumbo nucifera]|uniref:Cytokinin hydroxylase-like n=2 Tax=Nelumbo nucifera TaxID=4432 RepID=A0A1U7Z3T2_NELNU|nr:PREDICTED: cytokinin hydroxylase-like [Nelumbo nucifera]DAD47382.1 TPA_asm: hypothetical protein HUJ06_017319 [Nelumbo nucifera]
MEIQLLKPLSLAMASLVVLLVVRALYLWWVLPIRAYRKLKRIGFGGPSPSFPLGNIAEMRKKKSKPSSSPSLNITHDIHSTVFPYFFRWRSLHGKVFIYWLGTEPFLYIADPGFLKQMSSGVAGKKWGKPSVFKYDRKPMFGNGLVMVEGDDWVHHRHTITPAFSPNNLKAMGSIMVESATKMIDQWNFRIANGEKEIDVERDIISTAAEIIANTAFGINCENGQEVFRKLRALQLTLFESNRMVGVPFSDVLYLKQTMQSRQLGKEIDQLLLSIITSRKMSSRVDAQVNLLGLLIAENEEGDGRRVVKKLTDRELVDECKTFFFGGHETTALALTWTFLLLALHPEWQNQLREEIKQVVGDEPLDPTMLAKLKKMGWVMNEVLRLYSPAPNVQRQAREDICVGDLIVPNGTNMWIDVVGMHHDPDLWGDDVNQFRPERFKKDSTHGGCKHRMGFLPFGFGGRMCVGRNLTMMEYKIVLTLILSEFSFSLSPSYRHSPAILLSLRPTHGLPLLLQPL